MTIYPMFCFTSSIGDAVKESWVGVKIRVGQHAIELFFVMGGNYEHLTPTSFLEPPPFFCFMCLPNETLLIF